MSDVTAEMAALREELAQIRTAMEQQRRLQVPREPTDITPSRLAEAINEILGYLRQANDIPVPDGQAEEGLDEFARSMERALDQAEALAVGARGQAPGQPPEKVGEENLLADLMPRGTATYQVWSWDDTAKKGKWDWVRAH